MPRFAAIDIGSNSVRMEVAEISGKTRILASERKVTRLGASVFQTGRISPDAIDLVCNILSEMAAVYTRYEINGIRAVATAAVRDASNQREFIDRASAALGTPVEVISGQEEARLIHLGVQNRWPHPKQRVLMIDIGGGSAEMILSDNGRIVVAVSKQLGALRLTELFLKNDPPTPEELHRMQEYIEERIAVPLRRMGSLKIDRVIGTSATASAVVCAVNGIARQKRETANEKRASTSKIRELYGKLIAGNVDDRRKITGIGPKRAEIIIPGAAVLLSILKSLALPSLYYSAAGVRDGIIADLAARTSNRSVAEMSTEQRAVVEEMATRYGVSLRHVRKVARMANDLFVALEPLHQLPHSAGRLLDAAAHLHDIGHFISDTRHHKHSYYIVLNSDMPGFTEQEREVVANLCRYHRKAMPTQDHSNWQPLEEESRKTVNLLAPLLRLADNLDRSRGQRVRSLECILRPDEVVLRLHSNRDVDLDAWATERAAGFFREVYNKPLTLVRARA
jgi:exopolyphosphatase/guanosine-5'-triphosphate,3'-diphosphate pyrophosphatase